MLARNKSTRIEIERSYRVCRQEARRAASSFCWSFRLLPPDRRRAMHALYAFSRRTDDLADGDDNSATADFTEAHCRRFSLAAWRTATRRVLDGEPSDDPILPAVADMVATFAINERHLFDLIDGVEMDLSESCYRSWSDLQAYCYKVASVVGLACIRIWGVEDPLANSPAIACGYALQLTNILRDVKEDAARHRIYLPIEDLEKFAYSPDELRQGVADDRFLALMKFEIERAKSLYGEAEPLAEMLAPRPRKVFRLMTGAYRELLEAIERRPEAVLEKRLRLGWRAKGKAMWRAMT